MGAWRSATSERASPSCSLGLLEDIVFAEREPGVSWTASSQGQPTLGSVVELEAQLAEIYFTHEFFKALTRYTSIDDVCSVIVDGMSGVLGAPVSCVYLVNREDWTLRLRAFQGCADDALVPVIPVTDTILGHAYQRVGLAQGAWDADDGLGAWASLSAAGVRGQAAVPLVAGESVLGVAVIALTRESGLSPSEADRLVALANQASLSLQNALLLAEFERLSVTDRLTQLYNHGYFHQRLEEEFGRATRFSHPLSLVLLDLDDFTAFNDAHGHGRGDDVLRAVSAVIRSALRDMDIAARYGGGQFAVLLPETSVRGALAVAERVRTAVAAQRLSAEGCDGLSCTISAGIATYPGEAHTAVRMVASATHALHRAKRAGKNRAETDCSDAVIHPQ